MQQLPANVPIPSPLNAGGKDKKLKGWTHPTVLIARKKRAAVVPVELKKDKKATNHKVADYLMRLLHQQGAFKKSLITKEWLTSLLCELQRAAATQITPRSSPAGAGEDAPQWLTIPDQCGTSWRTL